MKRFHELTKPQQDQAVNFALAEMKECVEMGIVVFDKPVTNEVLTDYAVAAAENAWYSQPSDKIIDDIADEE